MLHFCVLLWLLLLQFKVLCECTHVNFNDTCLFECVCEEGRDIFYPKKVLFSLGKQALHSAQYKKHTGRCPAIPAMHTKEVCRKIVVQIASATGGSSARVKTQLFGFDCLLVG